MLYEARFYCFCIVQRSGDFKVQTKSPVESWSRWNKMDSVGTLILIFKNKLKTFI